MGDAERLDADRLEVLRRWGEGLGQDSRDEVRAAGKAITLLVAEVERLHVEVWHARPEPPQSAVDAQPLWGTLLGRFRRRPPVNDAEVSTGRPQAEESSL